jgi:hypothetical protein
VPWQWSTSRPQSEQLLMPTLLPAGTARMRNWIGVSQIRR